MYKNFSLTDKERKQILEMHQSKGYKKPMNEDIGESTNKVTLVGVETPDDLNVDFDYDVVKIFSNRDAAREYASYLENTQTNGSVFMRDFDVLNSFNMEDKPSYDIPGFEGTMDKLNDLGI